MRTTRRMGPGLKLLLGLILLVAVVVGVISLFGWGPDPEVQVQAARPGIGQSTGVTVTVREPWRGVGNVRAVLRQGEREEVVAEQALTTRPLWQVWGVNLVEVYGQTEEAGAIISGQPGPFPRPGNVGRVASGWELRLSDDGEILVRGPHVFEGYWGNPAATREVLDAIMAVGRVLN